MTQPNDDAKLERVLGAILRLGVAASSLCLAIGLSMTLAAHSSSGPLLLNAGVVLLVATPAVRVIISAATFAIHREWLFAMLVLIVLLELLAALVAALQRTTFS